jgi:hypothetical protein
VLKSQNSMLNPDAQGLRLAITEAVAGRLDEAIEAGHGDEDVAAVYRVSGGDA